MFVRPRDKERETWTGRRAGIEGAMIDYGADKAYTIEEFETRHPALPGKASGCYYPLGLNEKINEKVLRMVRIGAGDASANGFGPSTILDPRELIHEARLQQGARGTRTRCGARWRFRRRPIKRAMRQARGGMMEWEIEALVDYTFRSHGAAGPSYPSIIASGRNAATLHYINNDREMRTGELLLIDAGCEYEFYASDVTRTFPIGARFTPRAASHFTKWCSTRSLKAIEVIRPGVRFDDPHEAALRVLVDGMRRARACSKGRPRK